MAYIQSEKPVSRWSKIVLTYKKNSGSWAWILHRGTGIALTMYLFLHIVALSSITKGEAAFTEEMKLFQKPIFVVIEFLLFIPVIYHSLNGFRIVLVDLGQGAKNHKSILKLVYIIAGILILFMAYLMLFSH
ncbi:MAG: succinate dehydrogenase, cytochrome b556 subunit [Chlorobiota bacterium]|jgi:succinate dehydrogenase / fumarate reductase cytochrome b subunit|nr:succinate dehydrogenase, cytochrome b556 subunit [Chlorobiota bacterium]QQS65541.1 MAG: succinate dehydrogenase, cytochrome b556 subunit [Chlorobiota bacterium]